MTTTSIRTPPPDPVTAFLAAVASASIGPDDFWTPDVALDATVPNWRFQVHGRDAVAAEYRVWFVHPCRFDTVRRRAFPGGEAVEYTISWEQDGVPHAAHHVHLLEVMDGRIVSDTVMCGGRWPASLLAEMEAARA